MITCSLALFVFLNFATQAAPRIPAQGCLIANESTQLASGTKVESRIKVYAQASNRIHKSVVSAASTNQQDTIPPMLQCWLDILNTSVEDIEANLERKKKSKALREFEIQLRRAVLDVQSYKIKAPVEQQDQIDGWVTQAEKIHERFMSFLFPR
jgi:hypothetical protein